jgi:hypothetical protein
MKLAVSGALIANGGKEIKCERHRDREIDVKNEDVNGIEIGR